MLYSCASCTPCTSLSSQYRLPQVLELVGTSTLEDSLQCTREHAIVCMTGMVGNKWYAPLWADWLGRGVGGCTKHTQACRQYATAQWSPSGARFQFRLLVEIFISRPAHPLSSSVLKL